MITFSAIINLDEVLKHNSSMKIKLMLEGLNHFI